MRLAFQPPLFLPRRALRWAYDQAYAEHLMDTPFLVFFITIDRGGIWFPYKGDEVLWTWPWTCCEREGDNRGKGPFISLGMSGNGEWGDARFWSLKELDAAWKSISRQMKNIEAEIVLFSHPTRDRAIGKVVKAGGDEMECLDEAFDNIDQRA